MSIVSGKLDSFNMALASVLPEFVKNNVKMQHPVGFSAGDPQYPPFEQVPVKAVHKHGTYFRRQFVPEPIIDKKRDVVPLKCLQQGFHQEGIFYQAEPKDIVPLKVRVHPGLEGCF